MTNHSERYRQPIRAILPEAVAILALISLALGFFWKLALTDQILPRGDAFTYFYPYWDYRNDALREGRLPHWNPDLFMGAPFLANSQSGVLYPPNWPLIGLDAPTAVKAAIVMHIGWAAIGMYVFARRVLNVSMLAGTLSGAIFALGGYLTSQVEHINQLQGLAWLPWAFWLWEEAAAGQRRAVVGLSLVLALQLLAGHTQTTFMTGVGLGLWALWATFTMWRRREVLSPVSAYGDGAAIRLSAPIGLLALAAILAAALAAAQLLPTLELTALSSRSSGLSFREALSFSLPLPVIGRSLLPGYGETSLFSEYIAYPGIITLILAIYAALARDRTRLVNGLILLAGAAFFLALAAYNPFAWLLVKFVPGFALFRVPARWLILFAFAGSGLASLGLDSLMALSLKSRPISARQTLLPFGAIAILMLLSLAAPVASDEIIAATAPSKLEFVLWALTALLAAALIWSAARWPANRAAVWGSLAASLALIELFVASQALPYNHLSAPAAWSSQRPAISTLLAEAEGQTPPARFLSLSDILFDPGDLREIEAIYGPYLSEQEIYDYVIATKHKEILAPNLPLAWGIPSMDGFDGGILPTRDFIHFTALFLDEEDVTPDGRLRENLLYVPDPYWLSISNVRYIIADKVYDAWVDGVYYDLQFPMPLRSAPDQPAPPQIEARPSQPFEATAIGIVGHLEGAPALPAGTTFGTVTVFPTGTSNGQPVVIPLLSGDHFTEAIGFYSPDQPEVAEYLSVLEVPPVTPERIEAAVAEDLAGALVIRGMTLIDQRSGAFLPLTLSPDIRVIHSGDVKIYELASTQPRAYVVCRPTTVGTADAMWSRLAEAEGAVILDPHPASAGSCNQGSPGEVAITSYAPERVEISATAQGSGTYLILSDALYPGWQVTVDGESAEILRANGMFRAVRLPPGEHTVVWSYNPSRFTAGVIVSGVSLLGVVLGLIFLRRRDGPA